VRGGADGVVAPEDDELAVDDVLVGGAVALAEGGLDGGLGGGAADAAFELRGAEAVPEAAAGGDPLHPGEGAAVAVGLDGLRAGLGDDRLPPAGDLAEGLAPGDALPLAAAFRTDALQGVGEPAGVVDVIEVGSDLGAEPALGGGVVGVGAEADGPAV